MLRYLFQAGAVFKMPDTIRRSSFVFVLLITFAVCVRNQWSFRQHRHTRRWIGSVACSV